MNKAEISEKIEILQDLNNELDQFDNLLDTVFSNKEASYNKLMEEISPEERIDLNWDLSFATYTLYYSKNRFK